MSTVSSRPQTSTCRGWSSVRPTRTGTTPLTPSRSGVGSFECRRKFQLRFLYLRVSSEDVNGGSKVRGQVLDEGDGRGGLGPSEP